MNDYWFEPLSRQHLEWPYDAYERLRRERPIHWHEDLQSWIISRYEHCAEIFSGHDLFAADYRRGGRSEDSAMISLLTLDPPEADVYRALARKVLRSSECAQALADTESWICDRISARLGCCVDLVSDLCIPASLHLIVNIMGISPLNEEVIKASNDIVRSMFSGLEPESYDPGMKARADLSEMLAEAAKSAERGALAELKQHPELPYLANSMRVMLLAGMNSASRFLGLALLTLLSGPGLRPLPAPEDMPTAVNELIRFDGPFQAMSRVTTRDVEFHSYKFSRGQEITCLVGSANRDESEFPQAEALLLGRRPNGHLAFGRGAHACVGVKLAMPLTVVLLSCLKRLAPDAILLASPVIDMNPTLRGVVHLQAQLL
jgi:cytochrome P450